MDAIRQTARVRFPGGTPPGSTSSNGSQASILICFRAVTTDIRDCHLPSFTAGGCFTEKGEFWLVRDLAEGRGSHQLDIAWHIGPTLSPTSSQQYLFTGERESLALLTAEGHWLVAERAP